MTDPTDDFAEHLRQQVLGAYGFDSTAELDAALEEELPGYLAAEAEYKAEQEAYLATVNAQIEAWNGWVTAYVANVAELWRTELNAFIRSPYMSQLVSIVNNVCAQISAFARAIDPSICHHNPTCFCRPAPFPAARDYHRRTRHRNRRRKP